MCCGLPPPPSLSSLLGILEAPHVIWMQDYHVTKTLIYVFLGLSDCCRFCANIFSMDSLRVPLNLVVTVRSRLGLPPWGDHVFAQ